MARAVKAAMRIARQVTKPALLVYRRDPDQVTIADAGLGELTVELVTDDGFTGESRAMDVLLPRDAIDFGAGPLEPQEGDTIDVTIEGQVLTLEVMAEGPDKAWRYESRFEQSYRIHTKEIDRV